MPTWFIIANPAAGSGMVRRIWPEIEKKLQELGWEFVYRFTEAQGHASALVHEAAEAGYRQIMAIGGDGTNHEVVNGIMTQHAAPSTDFLYTLLPVGTGNDWIKMYGIPNNWRKWLEKIPQAVTRWQDIGKVSYLAAGQTHERFFTNVAGLSYDAFVVEAIESNKHKVTNRFLYLWWIIKCLFQFKLPRARIEFNGEVVEDLCYTINIGICKYSGGGMQFAPHAIPDDGLLALTIARKVPRWQVITNTPRFYSGTLDRHPQITIHQTEQVTVNSVGNDTVLVEADGEFLGETPAVFTIIKKALNILGPG
jgi:YegS/Rv2252/BmrU family lipid kinase